MDKIMGWLMEKLDWLPKLGFGKQWYVGRFVIKLWPFVALALFVLILVGIDYAITSSA